MTYAVIWLPVALNQFADAWMTAADRTAVAAASHRIDHRLAADPFN